MEEMLQPLAHYVAPALNATVTAVIAFGAASAIVGIVASAFHRHATTGPERRQISLDVARRLVAGLTFQLAADFGASHRAIAAPTERAN